MGGLSTPIGKSHSSIPLPLELSQITAPQQDLMNLQPFVQDLSGIELQLATKSFLSLLLHHSNWDFRLNSKQNEKLKRCVLNKSVLLLKIKEEKSKNLDLNVLKREKHKLLLCFKNKNGKLNTLQPQPSPLELLEVEFHHLVFAFQAMSCGL